MAISDLGQVLAQQTANLNQQMAQMNAHLRASASQAATNMSDAINGFYSEARRYVKSFDEQRGLRYRPATIQLSATVLNTTSGSADFRVSANEDFVVHEIRTFMALNDIANETYLLGGTQLSPLELATAKGLNCTLQLLNKDTKVPIMENANISFATLCPEMGGHAMKFNPDVVPGFIIPHNVTMQVLFSIGNVAQLIQRSTTYGIALYGAYMSRDRY